MIKGTSDCSAERGDLFFLGMLMTSFLCGGIVGTGFAWLGETSGLIRNHLELCISVIATEGVQISLLEATWDVLRWPLLVLLLGLTPIRLIAMPAAFFMRGFLFSHSVTSIMSALGHDGILLSVTIFAATGILALPCLFIFGCESVKIKLPARDRVGGRPLVLFIGMLIMMTCIAAQYLAVPRILQAICVRLFF